jgi:hypothetical protein
MTLGLVLLVVAMLGATALAGGGYIILRDGSDKTRGWLMIVASIVVVANVLILTI